MAATIKRRSEQWQTGKAAYDDQPLGDTLVQLTRIVHSDQPVSALLSRFTRTVASSLHVDRVEILEHLPGRGCFAIRSHAGEEVVCGEDLVPENLQSQAGYTFLRGKPVVTTDIETEDRYEMWAGLKTIGIRNGVSVPVPPDSSRYGVLGAYCREPRSYTDDEIAFLVDAARCAATVLVRYRETTHRRDAEQRLRMVEEAALRAASALDEHIALQSFVRLFSRSRDGLADVSFIDLEQETTIYRAAAAVDGAPVRPSPETKPLLYPQEPGAAHGAPAVLFSGQPDIITEVTDEHLRSLARDDEHLQALEDLNLISYLCVPIKIRRHTLGGLILMSRTRPYDDRDARHAARLAGIVGLAITSIRARMVALSDARDHLHSYFPDAAHQDSTMANSTPAEIVTSQDLQEEEPTAKAEVPGETVLLPGQMGNVLSLLVEGLQVKEIANIMGTTTSAVYQNDYRLRRRFGVQSRTELIARARQLGYGS